MSSTSKRSRIWLFVGITFLLLLGAAVALPFIYKDKIVDRARLELNKQLNAEVKFKSIDLTFITTFPKFGLQLADFAIIGRGEFDEVPLMKTELAEVTIDFWSVFNGGPYLMRSFYLRKPDINVVVLKNSKANYDIMKPSKTTSTTSSTNDFKLELQKYQIVDGNIHYTDFSSGFETQLKGVNHKGSGDLSASNFGLNTVTKAKEFSVWYAGVPYLKKALLTGEVAVDGDMNNSKYTLKDNRVTLNDLELKADGFVQLMGDAIRSDVKFSAPATDFSQLLSVLPGMYSEEIKNVDAKGTFALKGFVKGDYDDAKGKFPAFGTDLDVKGASFKYPSMPMGVSDIAADLHVQSPGSDFDKMLIDMKQLRFKLGTNPFESHFTLRTPVSDPDVDGFVKGIINLADVAKAVPMEDMEQINGLINADITAKAKMSAIDAKAYDKVNMKGNLQVTNMQLKPKGQPLTNIRDLKMAFTPNNVQLANFAAQIGKSDIQASGVIDNLLALFSADKTMTGNIVMRSKVFDANEWLTPTETVNENAGLSQAGAEAEKPFDRFNFAIDGQIDQLKYEKHDVRALKMAGQFTPNKMEVKNMSAAIGTSDFALSGVLNNVFNYLYNGDVLGGNIVFNSNNMDLNAFMTDDAPKTEDAPAENVLLVPELIDLNVQANMKKVKYTNLDLDNVATTLRIKDKVATIVNGNAQTLGGNVALAGAYNTSNANKPTFDLKYELQQFDFQRTFAAFNTVQKLAPIAKFMTGKFNTTMALSGDLGKDMTPKIETLNLAGMVHTLKAVITGLKPVQQISQQLNVSYLNNLEMNDTRNWFEVKNGNVHVVDSDFKYKDIMLRVGGDHSVVNESMQYNILTKVPRKLLEQNPLGTAANVGLGALTQQASKLGVNIKQGEFLNVLFTITGSMLQPKVAMKLLSADGNATIQDAVQDQVDAVVAKAKDSIKTRANQEIDKAKDKVKDKADQVVDSATIRLEQEAQKAKDRLAEEARKKATEAVGGAVGAKVGDKVGQTVQEQLDKTNAGKKAKEEAERLKNKLDGWNPLGGKKKKD